MDFFRHMPRETTRSVCPGNEGADVGARAKGQIGFWTTLSVGHGDSACGVRWQRRGDGALHQKTNMPRSPAVRLRVTRRSACAILSL